jgi:hypothetical protein
MANELVPVDDETRAGAATGTTQLLERAIILLLFAGVWSRDEVVRVDLEDGGFFDPGIADGLERGSPS